MKKLFVLIGVIFIQALFLVILLPKVMAADTVTHPNCLQITVKFNAPAAWQKSSSNRSIQIGCSGQVKPTGAHSCEGAVLTLKPGEKKTLGNCSCFNKQGCLKVGKALSREKDSAGKKWVVSVAKPLDTTLGNKCSVKYVDRSAQKPIKLTSICGTNKQRFNVAINISCSGPKPPPECVGPKPVTNVKVTCPTCDANGLIPTPTPIQEGGDCFNNKNACAPGLVCANGGLCQAAPSPTPTPTITPTPNAHAL